MPALSTTLSVITEKLLQITAVFFKILKIAFDDRLARHFVMFGIDHIVNNRMCDQCNNQTFENA